MQGPAITQPYNLHLWLLWQAFSLSSYLFSLLILESRAYEFAHNKNTKYSHLIFLIDVCKFSETHIYLFFGCLLCFQHLQPRDVSTEGGPCVTIPFLYSFYSLYPQLRVFPFAEQEPALGQQWRLKSNNAKIWYYSHTIIFSRTGLRSAFLFNC